MVYFFSYGDDNFRNSKERLRMEALRCGYLDVVDIYGPEHLSQDFINKTSPYIQHPRGGGYWMWKTFFIKKTFEKMKEGDYCVYVDAGCTVNPNGKERFNHYLSLLDQSESGIFRFKYGNVPVENYTNEKVFEYWGKTDDRELRTTDILMGGVMIFKKNEYSQKFVDRYLEIAETAPYLFSDEYNNYNRRETLVDHRHDQSVSSCLIRLEAKEAVTFQDETYAPDMDGWRHLFEVAKIPFLATRIRS